MVPDFTTGIPQGCILGLLLFFIDISYYLLNELSSNVKLFGDVIYLFTVAYE